MGEQHDDHVWITVFGESWAIECIMRGPGNTLILDLWRGYEPDLERLSIEVANFDAEAYCAAAVEMLEAAR